MLWGIARFSRVLKEKQSRMNLNFCLIRNKKKEINRCLTIFVKLNIK